MLNRRTQEERKTLCETWKQSGLTKVKFCKQNNVGIKAFYRWLGKLKKSKTDVASAKDNGESVPFKFLRVNNTAPKKDFNVEKSFLEITLPSGINFKASISQGNIDNFLQELLKWK